MHLPRLVDAAQNLLALFDPFLLASTDRGNDIPNRPVDKQKNGHGIAVSQKNSDAHHRDPERKDSFYGSYGWTDTYCERG